MVRNLSWLTSFAVLLSLTHSNPSLRCVEGGSVKGAAKEAVAVFLGKAVAQEYLGRSVGSGESIAYRFKVERVWKGEVAEEVLLVTQQVRLPNGLISFLDEDFIPREGERYLVFAYRGEGGRLTTLTCSRSHTLEKNDEDMSMLGVSHKPKKKRVK
jgi:hypothetical protein